MMYMLSMVIYTSMSIGKTSYNLSRGATTGGYAPPLLCIGPPHSYVLVPPPLFTTTLF